MTFPSGPGTGASTPRGHLEALDVALSRVVVPVVFDAAPPTRRPSAQFKPRDLLEDATREVAAQRRLGARWLSAAVRGYVGEGGLAAAFLELPNLRVFEARADYVLAMKCAALPVSATPRDLDDIRLLLRLVDVGDAQEAIDVARRYIGERAVPDAAANAL
jgi:hypothetical protein